MWGSRRRAMARGTVGPRTDRGRLAAARGATVAMQRRDGSAAVLPDECRVKPTSVTEVVTREAASPEGTSRFLQYTQFYRRQETAQRAAAAYHAELKAPVGTAVCRARKLLSGARR